MSHFSDKTGLSNPAIQVRLEIMKENGSKLAVVAEQMISEVGDRADNGRMIAFLDALSHAEHDLIQGTRIFEMQAKKRRRDAEQTKQ